MNERHYSAMKMVPTFHCLVDGFGYTIQFAALTLEGDGARPGFTHRVIVNRHSVGFLAEGQRPSRKSARFFLDKYLEDAMLEKSPISRAALRARLGEWPKEKDE